MDFFCCSESVTRVANIRKRRIKDHFQHERDNLLQYNEKLYRESLLKNTDQIQDRHKKLKLQIKEHWDKFIERYGKFRPIIDFLVALKLQELDKIGNGNVYDDSDMVYNSIHLGKPLNQSSSVMPFSRHSISQIKSTPQTPPQSKMRSFLDGSTEEIGKIQDCMALKIKRVSHLLKFHSSSTKPYPTYFSKHEQPQLQMPFPRTPLTESE